MSIHFYNENVDLPSLNFEMLRKVLKSELSKNKKKIGDINFIFCNDEYLLAINVNFLSHDYFTDVITFDYSADEVVSGDIYISTDTVFDNSLTFKETFHNELVRVICHGLLHLLKFNDKEEAETKVMREKEDEMLSKFFLD